MRETGTIILLATWALSAVYLVTEKLIVRKPLPGFIQWLFIRVGIIGAVVGFALYFIGG
jgi:hypothetical protein